MTQGNSMPRRHNTLAKLQNCTKRRNELIILLCRLLFIFKSLSPCGISENEWSGNPGERFSWLKLFVISFNVCTFRFQNKLILVLSTVITTQPYLYIPVISKNRFLVCPTCWKSANDISTELGLSVLQIVCITCKAT